MKELSVTVPYAGWTRALFQKMEEGVSNAEEMFEYAKNCGIEAIDFSLEAPLSFSRVGKREKAEFYLKTTEELLEYFAPVKAAAEKTGIELPMAHAPFPTYVADDDDYNEYLFGALEKSIAVCGYLGIPAVVIHPQHNVDKALERELNLALYRKLIPIAKKHGVKICLENLFVRTARHVVEGCCCDPDEAIDYIDTLNAEAGVDMFGFCFDLGHANITNINFRDFIRKLGKRIMLVHLHDNDGVEDMHRIPMTLLRTDWEGLIAGLRDIGYRGPLDFEIVYVLFAINKNLVSANLRYISEVGKYLRERLLADE